MDAHYAKHNLYFIVRFIKGSIMSNVLIENKPS